MKKLSTKLGLLLISASLFFSCTQEKKEQLQQMESEVEISRSVSGASTNGTMMQYFHWYYPSDGSLWNKVETEAGSLADMGVTALWLPPAYKGDGGGYDVGYGVYDMYDLGEFDQKGSVRTKYGTKDQYLDAIQAAHNEGINVYGDVVFNHRGGADSTAWVDAVKVDWNNRNYEIENKWIQAWVNFDFPGRNNKYSDFKWRWYHFDGVDWDQAGGENAIFRFKGDGKGWDWDVDGENSNYDYLMYADLDMDHPEVKQELKDWGVWYSDFTNIDGFRMDAVKHIKFQYLAEWINYVRSVTGKELFTVGEYWNYDVGKLHNFITKTNGTMSLFDAPLHMNFYNASKSGGNYDMRNIMNGTLMKENPVKAVTIVENHDTQPLQALESPVDYWFKPLAYAFILLREEGYPCVFYPDVYGASYTDKGYNINLAPVDKLDKLMKARNLYAYGEQKSYLDHWDIVGWTRGGDSTHPNSMAVIMTDGPGGTKWMDAGKANTEFYDYLGNRSETVWSNNDGWAEFPVNGGSVSVWVSK